MKRIRQFLAITELSARESIRQTTTLLLLLTMVAGCVLTPLAFMHDFGEDGQMARNTSLALHFLLGMFVAVTAAAGSLAREMQSGTAATVLSKPVGRATVLLAKFSGVAVMVVMFSIIAAVCTLLSHRIAERFFDQSDLFGYVKDLYTAAVLVISVIMAMLLAGFINYRTRRPFASWAFMLILAASLTALLLAGFYDQIGRFRPYNMHVAPAILGVSLLLTMALLVITAIAISISTVLPPTTTLAVCSVLFVAGLGSDHFFGGSTAAWSRIAYAIIPNWQHFWLADALNDGGSIPLRYLFYAAVYTVCYSTAVLAAGIWAFRKVDVQ